MQPYLQIKSDVHSQAIVFLQSQIDFAKSQFEKGYTTYAVKLNSEMPKGYSLLHVVKRPDETICFAVTEDDQYDVISIAEAISICMTHVSINKEGADNAN